jgi:hypothetical protein
MRVAIEPLMDGHPNGMPTTSTSDQTTPHVARPTR